MYFTHHVHVYFLFPYFFLSLMRTAYIYNGEGSSAIREISIWLKSLIPSLTVVFEPAASMKIRNFSKNDIIVMPGGRDRPYVRDLGVDGVDNIRKALDNGTYFLGICAGAYFSTSHIHFELGRPGWEVDESRNLRIYDAPSVGVYLSPPLYDTTYKSELAAKVIPEASDSNKMEPFSVFFTGGGAFVEEQGQIPSGCEVLARYEESRLGLNQPPAIVLCNRSLLTFGHFELGIGNKLTPKDVHTQLEVTQKNRQSFENWMTEKWMNAPAISKKISTNQASFESKRILIEEIDIFQQNKLDFSVFPTPVAENESNNDNDNKLDSKKDEILVTRM